MAEFRGKFSKVLAKAYHNVLRLEETKRKYSRTTTSFRGRNAMEFIYEAEDGGKGGRRTSEIADYLKITRPSATALIKKLEALDYVRREPDPDDARSERICLTRRGRLVTKYQTGHRDGMIDRFIDDFTDDELEILYRGFSKLNEVFENCADTLEENYNRKHTKAKGV